MNIGLALLGLLAGFLVGVSGAVGVLCIWWGRRDRAYRLLSLGVWLVLDSLAGLALLLWLTPSVGWGMGFLGVALGIWFVWLLARSRLSCV